LPNVSVCIPTFNRVNLLSGAIDSVLQQTYTDWEVIVCDDGSTDDTAEMMATLTDRRIRYLRHPQNIGKSNNMISGFEAASGEYFIKFDDDDRLTPEFLTRTCAVLADDTIDFVSTDHWVIDIDNERDLAKTDANSQRWGRADLPAGTIANLLELAFIKQPMQIGATLFRRQTLQTVGYMRPNLQNCEDNDLFVRLALAGAKGYYLPERLMEYRFHAEQHSLDRAARYLADKLQYLESYQFESDELTAVQQGRIAETKLLLGLRLVEKGETQKGQALLRSAQASSPPKALAGLALSLLPMSVRGKAFNFLRKLN